MRLSGMRPVKCLHLIMALIFVGVLFASPVWSQDDAGMAGIMELKSRGFSQHYQPSVRFDHYLHESILRCRVCHHDFNVFRNRNFGKGSKCASCHKEKLKKDLPVPLLMAFHKKCRGCHENYLKWGRSSGPVMCGICHK